MHRLLTWTLLVLLCSPPLLGVPTPLGLSTPTSDDDKPTEYSRQLVFIDSVEPYKKSGKTYLVVQVRVPDLPPDTVIDFHLTFRAMTIEVYPVTVRDSSKFTTEFEVAKIPRSRDKFYFRTIIESVKQTSAVKKHLADNPKIFSPGLDPWTDHHYDHKFRLLSLEEEAESLEPIRAFFRERLEKIENRRETAVAKAELASLGEEFTDEAGSFSADKWSKFLETEIVGALVTVADEAEAAVAQTRYIPFRRALVELAKTARHAALDGYSRSIEVYRENGLTPPKAHVKAAGLGLAKSDRRKLQGYDRQAGRRVIDEELGIVATDRVEDPFRLVVSSNYEGILFRHLTPEELERGKFDPVRASATWTPTDEQVAGLESSLKAFLASQPKAARIAEQLDRYRRQYIGLGPEGDRRIRVGLVHLQSTRIVETIRTVLPAGAGQQIVTLSYSVGTGAFEGLDLGDGPGDNGQ